MSKIMQAIEAAQLKKVPEVKIGSTVRVNYRIKEGEKERIQAFEGVMIAKHLSEKNSKATFTVRKVSQGYGIERIFLLHSPFIESIKTVKEGVVRRAKLYYLRDRVGKSAKLKEKIVYKKKQTAK